MNLPCAKVQSSGLAFAIFRLVMWSAFYSLALCVDNQRSSDLRLFPLRRPAIRPSTTVSVKIRPIARVAVGKKPFFASDVEA